MFAPVTPTQQERIFTYVYQDRKLFDVRSAVCVQGLEDPDYAELRDFQYLYPVHISKFGDFTIIESTVLTQDQLEVAFYDQKMVYNIEGLDPIKSTYAGI